MPELQRRGLYHKEYAGQMLRENLGVPVPHATWRNADEIGPVAAIPARTSRFRSSWCSAPRSSATTVGVDRRGLRLGRRHAAGVHRRADQAHPARHRHHAARRAHAGQCRDAVGTVDALAGGGRFIAGLGVSGPQIVEGWYGEPWGRPYYRCKDYVAIMRKIFTREAPVTHDGREISLPYTGEGAWASASR